jgi:hypothetical protein
VANHLVLVHDADAAGPWVLARNCVDPTWTEEDGRRLVEALNLSDPRSVGIERAELIEWFVAGPELDSLVEQAG